MRCETLILKAPILVTKGFGAWALNTAQMRPWTLRPKKKWDAQACQEEVGEVVRLHLHVAAVFRGFVTEAHDAFLKGVLQMFSVKSIKLISRFPDSSD